MEELVSIILSTYNEPLDMLNLSIQSILSQTYKNIQFIIINDNPKREDLDVLINSFLKENTDKIVYIKNEANIGLVKSLNTGIKFSKGTYIARMDADDIAEPNRIEEQLKFLKENNCDIVGANIILIDEKGYKIGEERLPVEDKLIKKYYNYGSCLFHPTWFAKKNLYEELNGYREIYACEDYDFIIRAIYNGYKLGNVPKFLLRYRVRKNGISVSTEAHQKLMMYFIKNHKYEIEKIDTDDFSSYINSINYKKGYKRINKYIEVKNSIKSSNNKIVFSILTLKLIFNKYFYINILANIKKRERKKYS